MLLLVKPDEVLSRLSLEAQQQAVFVLNCVVRHIWRTRTSLSSARPLSSPQALLATFEAALLQDLVIAKTFDVSFERWQAALRPLYSG